MEMTCPACGGREQIAEAFAPFRYRKCVACGACRLGPGQAPGPPQSSRALIDRSGANPIVVRPWRSPLAIAPALMILLPFAIERVSRAAGAAAQPVFEPAWFSLPALAVAGALGLYAGLIVFGETLITIEPERLLARGSPFSPSGALTLPRGNVRSVYCRRYLLQGVIPEGRSFWTGNAGGLFTVVARLRDGSDVVVSRWLHGGAEALLIADAVNREWKLPNSASPMEQPGA
jgi:hypothetical protein